MERRAGDALSSISEAHYSNILSVNFSPDGSYIASGSQNEEVSIWDVRSGDLILGPLRGHAGGVTCAAFSPDGVCVIAGSWDHTIRVWDVRRYLSSKLAEEENNDVSVTSMSNEGISDWSLTANGWIERNHGERLLWIPPDLRASLWYPQNTAVFGCAFSTKLDFKDAALGKRWLDCFRLT